MVTSEAIESPSKRKDFLKVSSDLQRDSIGRSSLQNDRYEALFCALTKGSREISRLRCHF